MRKGFCVVIIVVFINSLAFAMTGSGTSASPYLIQSYSDFQAFIDPANASTYWAYGIYTRLETDIDLDPALPDRVTYTNALISPNTTPGSTSFGGVQYNGHFDGNGHIIDNMTINNNDNYLAFVGYLGSNGSIKNLGLRNIEIVGGDDTSYAGGLAGYSAGLIEACYVTGTFSAYRWSGGFVGRIDYSSQTYDCYAQVNVTYSRSGYFVGGFVGNLNSSYDIRHCYSAGLAPSGAGFSSSDGGVSICFWDTQSSMATSSEAGFGRTTAQMKTAANYEGWGSGKWTINEGVDYPRLSWENKPGTPMVNTVNRTYTGSGMSHDPYMLATAEDLAVWSRRVEDWDDYVQLKNDIDMEGVDNYWPIGCFSGNLDGQGHLIMNLTVDMDTNYVGLVGYSYGNIRNLVLHNCNITGKNRTGALVGSSVWAQIDNCGTTGSVSGTSYVGGLVGYFVGWMNGCYSRCNVTGTGQATGGLAGMAFNSEINNCYARGTVAGGNYDTGGLLGENGWSNDTLNCYSTGAVTGSTNTAGLIGDLYSGTVSNSFWDTSSSQMLVGYNGSGTASNVYGYETGVMKTQNTYCDYGWDFVGETANGTEDIWKIEAGNYPQLVWEQPLPEPPCEYVLLGDVNNDCRFNLIDLASMSANWLVDCRTNPTHPGCVPE